jgi:5-methyltetrahydrofolate--homocysteine methyltransferase
MSEWLEVRIEFSDITGFLRGSRGAAGKFPVGRILGEWSGNAMALLEGLREAVVDGQAKLAVAKVTEGLDGGIEAGMLLREGLIAAMAQVGKLYEEGEIFVPEMLVAARAMTAALTVLKPHLVEEGVASGGTVAIGTTQGDLHDIGKNLVAMMLEGSGYEIVDLGVDVPAEKFIEAIRNGANVVAMSALLTTTMTNMQLAIEAIKEAGLRDQVRIIVGGAPITKSYADEIGADGYAEDASSAVRLVKEVLAA